MKKTRIIIVCLMTVFCYGCSTPRVPRGAITYIGSGFDNKYIPHDNARCINLAEWDF